MKNSLIKVTKVQSKKRFILDLADVESVEEHEIEIDKEMKDCTKIVFRSNPGWVKIEEDLDTIFEALKSYREEN